MIALARKQHAQSLHDRFTELLPTIRDQLRFAFRHEPPERKEDMIAEAIANCWVAFVKLVERGLDDAIYATPLAQYAVRQVYDGRKVGGTLNQNDVSSEYAQRKKQFTVERLHRYPIVPQLVRLGRLSATTPQRPQSFTRTKLDGRANRGGGTVEGIPP